MTVVRVPLGDIADFVNGVAFKPSDWQESGRRIVRIQNLTNPTKPFNRTNRMVDKRFEVVPGDVLVSWSATLGVFAWEGPDTALVNQHIFRVVPDLARVDRSYLRHMLAGALVEVERHLHGATMKHVNRREFLATAIPLPSLAEQKRISQVLDAADALRAKSREALAQLDMLVQSTFLDVFGDPAANPEGWSECAIGDTTTKCQAWNPRKHGKGMLEYIDLSSIDKESKEIISTEEHRCAEAPSRARQLVETGDVLVATVRPNLNGVALIGDEHDGLTASTGYCVLRPNRGVLESAYLFHWVRSDVFVQRMVDVATGANYPAVSDAKVRASSMPLPPLDVQRRFATIVESVERQKALQRAHLAELDTLFASLQQRAFNGELSA